MASRPRRGQGERAPRRGQSSSNLASLAQFFLFLVPLPLRPSSTSSSTSLQLTRPMICCCCMGYNNIRMHLTSSHLPFPCFLPTSRGETDGTRMGLREVLWRSGKLSYRCYCSVCGGWNFQTLPQRKLTKWSKSARFAPGARRMQRIICALHVW